ncbi:MAG: divalent metal cation transporter [Planctomycetaceae bacterium]|nr:divalent metal cation transporter [Planctomycetaceae bacterium]
MSTELPGVERDRQLLIEARREGTAATLLAFIRLSGPGWLQSAITLGGGSLAGAMFLGILGGTSLLWLQLVAIVMGVVMLSAISYVTLSTGEKPFQAINAHINPVLGWGWIVATMLANIIWCMPQFSLSFAAIQNNLAAEGAIADTLAVKLGISILLLGAATIAVFLNTQQGIAARMFDWVLKLLVGVIVVCFVGVVLLLTVKGALDWQTILAGFVPDLSQWSQPSGRLRELFQNLPADTAEYWRSLIVSQQREVMIGAAATAVGINMTFLMPYSLLRRGWGKDFRGLSRFDLSTGMAIPYILVTSCVVIAAAVQFHAQAEPDYLSNDPDVMQQSSQFKGAKGILLNRVRQNDSTLTEDTAGSAIADLSREEKIIALALVKRDAFELSKALAPLLGEGPARTAFGLGIFGMGFSTIIILMLINGFALCEVLKAPLGGRVQMIGCLIAGVAGTLWPFFWQGDSKVYLAIIASSFGMMLLPIAYITFFMMMNSRRLLGAHKPVGRAMVLWNVLMGASVAGAIIAAYAAIAKESAKPGTGPVVATVAILFLLAVGAGFLIPKKDDNPTVGESPR